MVSRHLLGAEMTSSPELRSRRDSHQLNHAKSYVYKLDAAGFAALTGRCPSASAKAQVQRSGQEISNFKVTGLL